jgi:hypothetical protein
VSERPIALPVDDGLTDGESFEGAHLSDAAVALLADGEAALVAARAREHATGCALCAGRVADGAIGSAEVHAAFAVLPEAAAARVRRQAELASERSSPRPLASGHPDRPAESRRSALWAIGGGLAVVAAASAPTLGGLARGIAEVRHALEVLVSVSLQTEQALRMASGRMEMVRMGASWIATLALVAVGLWIARRGPQVQQAEKVEEAR